MMKPMILAAILCAPLSPQADQARLARLLPGVTVVQTWRPPVPPRMLRSTISTVAAVAPKDACDTRLVLRPRNDRLAELVIDWSQRNRRVSRDGLYVSLTLPPRAGQPATVTFVFPSTAEAAEATAAFERLAAACAPQA